MVLAIALFLEIGCLAEEPRTHYDRTHAARLHSSDGDRRLVARWVEGSDDVEVTRRTVEPRWPVVNEGDVYWLLEREPEIEARVIVADRGLLVSQMGVFLDVFYTIRALEADSLQHGYPRVAEDPTRFLFDLKSSTTRKILQERNLAFLLAVISAALAQNSFVSDPMERVGRYMNELFDHSGLGRSGRFERSRFLFQRPGTEIWILLLMARVAEWVDPTDFGKTADWENALQLSIKRMIQVLDQLDYGFGPVAPNTFFPLADQIHERRLAYALDLTEALLSEVVGEGSAAIRFWREERSEFRPRVIVGHATLLGWVTRVPRLISECGRALVSRAP